MVFQFEVTLLLTNAATESCYSWKFLHFPKDTGHFNACWIVFYRKQNHKNLDNLSHACRNATGFTDTERLIHLYFQTTHLLFLRPQEHTLQWHGTLL